MRRLLAAIAFCFIFSCSSVRGGVSSISAREAAEYLSKVFGREIGELSVKTLSEKIAQYGAKYGDEAIEAIRKVGPSSFKLIDDAGENAPAVVRLLNRHGNEAVWVASKPGSLAIFIKHGDEAAKAMIKHPGIANGVIEEFGVPAATALQSVSSQNARRIAMLANEGTLGAAGKAEKIFGVIGRYGDRAADWIWTNKGALATVAVVNAFVTNPQQFIDGTVEVVRIGAKYVVQPVAEKAAAAINWNLFAAIAALAVAALMVARFGWRWMLPRRHTAQASTPSGPVLPPTA